MCHGLKAMSENKIFNAKQRAKALEMLNVLKDRKFVLMLNFRLDLLNQLKYHSLLFQKRGALIFDKYEARTKLINAFEEMMQPKQDGTNGKDGPYLDTTLKEMKCSFSIKPPFTGRKSRELGLRGEEYGVMFLLISPS